MSPVRVFHFGFNLPQNLKGILPQNLQNLLFISLQENNKVLLCSLFPLPITNANTSVLVSLRPPPRAWHVPEGPRGGALRGTLQGKSKRIKETV